MRSLEDEYNEWVQVVPHCFKDDSLWQLRVYRLALFVGEQGWHDVDRLVPNPRTRGLADQLYRALGSISANLAEGYSRGTGRDRARFLEYALGSARESREWYYKGRHVLGDDVVAARLDLLTQIVRLLLTMIPNQRSHSIREGPPVYEVESGVV